MEMFTQREKKILNLGNKIMKLQLKITLFGLKNIIVKKDAAVLLSVEEGDFRLKSRCCDVIMRWVLSMGYTAPPK